MTKGLRSIDKLISALEERAKELNCLYQVEDLLSDNLQPIENVYENLLDIIPTGWQYVDVCLVRIIQFPNSDDEKEFADHDFQSSEWRITADVLVQNQLIAELQVYYTTEKPDEDTGPFLHEELNLLQTIAERLSQFIQHQQMRSIVERWESAKDTMFNSRRGEWKIVMEMLRRTDKDLFIRVTRQMLNMLCWNNVAGAQEILQQLGTDKRASLSSLQDGGNQAAHCDNQHSLTELSPRIFKIASKSLPDKDLLKAVQKWMQEEKSSFLIRACLNLESNIGDIADALRRFNQISEGHIELSDSTCKGLRATLLRRLISDQLDFLHVAKDYIDVKDFIELIPRLIFPNRSHGQLGGKAAGLFLASNILKRLSSEFPELEDITMPKTWFIASDGVLSFMSYNNLEEVTEQKYKDLGRVRQEFPHLVMLFKNSNFPPDLVKGLSMALDDFGDRPLIVRSSSLLEDRFGAAFSGKYTSLFLVNQGSKQERLTALLDAVAEVYSSIFGPDPIEYRADKGFLDYNEQMGIIIQEVVGKRFDKYFFPAYAGVAFSNNELRWSPRIKRDDGLVRLVPGLGTRAVDRLSDDYPMLVAPGQPGLRVNTTNDEIIRYSPQKLDVLNLETNEFQTVNIEDLIDECGVKMHGADQLFSQVKNDQIQPYNAFTFSSEDCQVIITFEGLLKNTGFVNMMSKILIELEKAMGVPVDIEFASDGEKFYLLQCRPQCYTTDAIPATIPHDFNEEDVLFTANRYISNGLVPDINYIVFVDPQKYSEVSSLEDLVRIGRAVGDLNKLLPQKEFILMGPGRWGSRGDIKLGVSVTYSDISNTSMLIEIARKQGNYVPDLSFGTHFFQDLVEASIRYLPLYPDDAGIMFNEDFLLSAENLLANYIPEFADLADVIHLVDIAKETGGKTLKVYMNSEVDAAVALMDFPEEANLAPASPSVPIKDPHSDKHWHWRSRMADEVARHLDAKQFGVEAIYLMGSTKNGTAGPDSDIDLLVNFIGNEEQKIVLDHWFNGWSQSLAASNFFRTGTRLKGILDIHYLSDDTQGERSNADDFRDHSTAYKKLKIHKKL
jgi:pyruvate, water dikinase